MKRLFQNILMGILLCLFICQGSDFSNLWTAPSKKAVDRLFDSLQVADDKYCKALIIVGKWCKTKKMRQETKEVYERILELSPAHKKAQAALSELETIDSWQEPAEKLKEQYQSKRKRADKARNNTRLTLAAQLAKLGEIWTAHRICQEALQSDPENKTALKLADKIAPIVETIKATIDKEITQAKGGKCIKDASEFGMEYAFRLPANYDPQKKYPVFIWNHGSGYDGPRAADTFQNLLGTEYILLGPTRTEAMSDEQACQNILKIMKRLISQFNADPEQIFLGGHSWGGLIAYHMIGHYSSHFAGIVPTYPNYRGGLPACKTPNPFPVLVLKGEEDEHNAGILNAEITAALAALKAGKYVNVEFQIVPDAKHSGTNLAGPIIQEWMKKIREGKK
ncbi:prolyl oligopeptidase family serine peptidase [Planctomycetota bacterium]